LNDAVSPEDFRAAAVYTLIATAKLKVYPL